MAISWDNEKNLLFNVLFPRVLAAAMAGAESSLGGLVDMGIGVDWALVNTAVQEWARQYTYDLVTKITNTTQAFVQDAISAWIESGAPLDDLIDSLAPMFGAVRAEMIAVTEVTRAFAEGNDAVWLASGLVDEFDIETAEDDSVCPLCLEAKANGPYRIGDPNGQPPFHVRCRCWKRPRLRGQK